MQRKTSTIHFFFFLIFISGFLACASNSKNPPTNTMDDGVYLIKRYHTDIDSLKPLNKDEVILKYNAKYTGDAEEEQEYVVVDSKDFVPLTLKEKPEAEIQADKRTNLLLRLNDIGAQKLEDFTGNHVNERVGTVIGSEVLTQHIIREKITGSTLQISRCHDNACEFLFLELEDNVVGK